MAVFIKQVFKTPNEAAKKEGAKSKSSNQKKLSEFLGDYASKFRINID